MTIISLSSNVDEQDATIVRGLLSCSSAWFICSGFVQAYVLGTRAEHLGLVKVSKEGLHNWQTLNVLMCYVNLVKFLGLVVHLHEVARRFCAGSGQGGAFRHFEGGSQYV